MLELSDVMCVIVDVCVLKCFRMCEDDVCDDGVVFDGVILL